jgi:hypothetical protein
MTALATSVRDFAALLTPDEANAVTLTGWIAQVRAADLPFTHSYATGIERDRAAIDAALTLPWHNGRTEGVNNKIKLIKRQTYGRAGHPLLRPAHPAQLTSESMAITGYENLVRAEDRTDPRVSLDCADLLSRTRTSAGSRAEDKPD